MRVLAIAAALLLAGCASDSTPTDADPWADSDGDGFPDDLEVRLESDPHNATSLPDVVAHQELVFAGVASILLGTENFAEGRCGVHGDVDTDVLLWTLEAPANSTDAKVTDLTVTAQLPATMIELDIFVFGPDGTQLTDATTASIPPTKVDTVTVEGVVPVGEYRIEIRGCEGTGDIDVEAKATLHYTPSVEELMHAEGVEHHH